LLLLNKLFNFSFFVKFSLNNKKKIFFCLKIYIKTLSNRKDFHKKPMSKAVYRALISLWDDIRQNGKFIALAADSSSAPSPTTT
ncbi:hypothetical protein DOY81_000519, partial [Sarcophaga bullata]